MSRFIVAVLATALVGACAKASPEVETTFVSTFSSAELADKKLQVCIDVTVALRDIPPAKLSEVEDLANRIDRAGTQSSGLVRLDEACEIHFAEIEWFATCEHAPVKPHEDHLEADFEVSATLAVKAHYPKSRHSEEKTLRANCEAGNYPGKWVRH